MAIGACSLLAIEPAPEETSNPSDAMDNAVLRQSSFLWNYARLAFHGALRICCFFRGGPLRP